MLNTEIKNAVVAYSVMKRDLHTLVEGSKSPLDYIGEIEEHPHITSFTYPIEEERQNREVYHALVSIGILIENMLKEDLRIWGKTRGIRCIEIAPDHRCETVVMEIIFQE